MIDYGLKDKVVLITGANNPRGIGAATAMAFVREGAKVVLVYKKILRPFDENKVRNNGPDRYYKANAGNADIVESRLKQLEADYLILEKDISDENSVKEIYTAAAERFGKIDILVNNAADCDCDGFDTILSFPVYTGLSSMYFIVRVSNSFPRFVLMASLLSFSVI